MVGVHSSALSVTFPVSAFGHMEMSASSHGLRRTVAWGEGTDELQVAVLAWDKKVEQFANCCKMLHYSITLDHASMGRHPRGSCHLY
jgi:hypothetical protein